MKNCLKIFRLFLIFGILVSSLSFAQLGCNPGTAECIDTTYYHICGDYGIWGPAVQCPTGQSCSTGQCIAPVGCKPGTSECVDSTSYHTCSDYAIWNPVQYCGSGQTCSNGQCTPVPQCSYQQTRCKPGYQYTVQMCDYNGQWQDWKSCSNGCYNGGCADCSPGDQRCTDSYSYEKCDSDRTWGPSYSCGKNYICQNGNCVYTSTGQCQNVGAVRCSPDSPYTVQKCSGNYRWQDWTNCPNGCDYGTCVQCGTGQTRCTDSQDYQVCNSQGQWGSISPCQSGYVCAAGSCQAPSGSVCSTAGAKRCSPSNANEVQICGSNNIYQDYLQCNQGCFNGQCAECKPGVSLCAGATSYRTCSAAGQLSDAVNCPAGYTCDNGGTCVATPQCSNGQRNCVSDTIYTCSNGQWQLLLQCPSDTDCSESAGTAYCAPENRTTPQPSQPTQPGFELGGLGIVFVVTTVVLAAVLIYLYFRMKKK